MVFCLLKKKKWRVLIWFFKNEFKNESTKNNPKIILEISYVLLGIFLSQQNKENASWLLQEVSPARDKTCVLRLLHCQGYIKCQICVIFQIYPFNPRAIMLAPALDFCLIMRFTCYVTHNLIELKRVYMPTKSATVIIGIIMTAHHVCTFHRTIRKKCHTFVWVERQTVTISTYLPTFIS